MAVLQADLQPPELSVLASCYFLLASNNLLAYIFSLVCLCCLVVSLQLMLPSRFHATESQLAESMSECVSKTSSYRL